MQMSANLVQSCSKCGSNGVNATFAPNFPPPANLKQYVLEQQTQLRQEELEPWKESFFRDKVSS